VRTSVFHPSLSYIPLQGLTDEGLFRRSPSSTTLRQVKDAYDRGQVVSLDSFDDPHLAAVLLKKYIRDLPEPLFPESLYPVIQQCPLPTEDPSDWPAVLYIRESLLSALPGCNYILLSYIFRMSYFQTHNGRYQPVVLDLMHDVSLRSSTNLMGAHNLAIVLCPNLVSGSSPAKDIAMCSLPGGPALHPELSASLPSSPQGRTTLSMIVKLCIQRYYEIFDEVQDRSEALPPTRSFAEDDVPPSGSSSPRVVAASIGNPTKRLSALSGLDDDESIDDTMLVMPVNATGGVPPSTWGPNNAGLGTSRGRPRSELSPVHTLGYAARAAGSGQVHHARSTISIEKTNGTMRGKGSVSIGRGTVRKAGGAGVEALGVTASRFFAPLPSKEESEGG
jgi:Rho GTPase-activating protein 1